MPWVWHRFWLYSPSWWWHAFAVSQIFSRVAYTATPARVRACAFIKMLITTRLNLFSCLRVASHTSHEHSRWERAHNLGLLYEPNSHHYRVEAGTHNFERFMLSSACAHLDDAPNFGATVATWWRFTCVCLCVNVPEIATKPKKNRWKQMDRVKARKSRSDCVRKGNCLETRWTFEFWVGTTSTNKCVPRDKRNLS